MPGATEETPAPVKLIFTAEVNYSDGPVADPSFYPREVSGWLEGMTAEVDDPRNDQPTGVRLRNVTAELAPADD
jgi:hypothetical protein